MVEISPTPEDWAAQLQRVTEAAVLAAVAAGWRVRSVTLIVADEDRRTPDMVVCVTSPPPAHAAGQHTTPSR